jgi:hypothetical protein
MRDPTIGRAEALRRAMLTYLSDPSSDDNANPPYWGRSRRLARARRNKRAPDWHEEAWRV